MARQSPIEFSAELCEEIADHIAAGGFMEPKLREISARLGKTLDRRVVNRWRKAHPEVGAMFDEAREAGFDVIAEDCIAIADDGSRDYVMEDTENGRRYKLDTDHIQRSRLRVDTRFKALAKWDPRRYGEVVTLKGDKANPLHVSHSVDLSDEDLVRIAKAAPSG